MLFPPFGRGRLRFSVMRGGHGAAFVWCFLFLMFSRWFQNGEVRGPRVSVGGAFRF
ncbi:hypothetical protein GYM05_000177 [Shigella sonnei]|nr:hypothetical protein [Salmonella enterica]EDS1039282.1 hypothetical protein [Salmonella enterica subsp. enterica serovar Telelkebir]EDT0023262.1 hypothetical protein [Salmonella enterica subsp. enterica serovar Baildon]EDT2062669.1 hypothetical protein [Salmonella enterica subsp. enterica serovar Anatum]EDT5196603.1 hypothetical protein [Salmonella enterica subsp. enterica serovar Braenderup]EDU9143290.1 hypothetical protein [Salmonella enterica subsp. enterica]EDW3705598.1 hypothetical pr